MASDELDALRAMWMARRDQPMPSVAEARANFETFMAAMPVAADIAFEPTVAAGRPAAWLRPAEAVDGRVLLFIHGGGFVIGSPTTHRGLAGDLARACRATTLSIDYRLAPEHPFPAALKDSIAAYRWLLDRRIAPDDILLAGDSAGAGLVVSSLVALRDAGVALPRAAVLFSPWVDLALAGRSFRDKVAADPRMTQDILRLYAHAYLGGAASPPPLASPLVADLAGLPPMLIQVGSDELLLDDATRLAAEAGHAGVKVRLDVWPGMVHVWQAYAPLLAEGRQAIAEAGEFLSRQG